MCGIAGILLKKEGRDFDRSRLDQMTASLHHRGPDDAGVEWMENVGLGFRRLSIIDLTQAGHQPMWDEQRESCIVFNGEIYNFPELRETLAGKGHQFRTRTDTEVILAAYREWGKECVQRFNGMWAFALYDTRRKELFCSRDRFAVKPFYYYSDRNMFVFASEIKAILASGLVHPAENLQRSFELVALGYMDTSTETLFAGIHSLRGGHSLTIRSDGQQTITRYWKLPAESADISLEAAAVQFHDLFLDSVRLRLRADVPLAVLLSGGQDSSAIVCVVDALRKGQLKELEQLKTQKLHTFSSCYADPRFDEREYIDAVVQQCDVEPSYLYPEPPDLLKDLRDLTYYTDEPVHNSSAYAHWTLMRSIAGKGIRVLLSGQGADEILAGYDRLLIGPQLMALATSGNVSGFREEFALTKERYGFSGAYVAAQFAKTAVPRSIWPPAKAVFVERAHEVYSLHHILQFWDAHKIQPGNGNGIARRLADDFLFNSLPRILHAEDRTSMAFSIEERFPFLDYRIVEFCFRLPVDLKIKKGETKRVLRRAVADLLPPKVRTRTSKIGFATPTSTWTRELIASPYIRELLDGGNIPGVPDDRLRSLKRWGLAGNIPDEHAKLLWRFIGYLVWRDVFGITSH